MASQCALELVRHLLGRFEAVQNTPRHRMLRLRQPQLHTKKAIDGPRRVTMNEYEAVVGIGVVGRDSLEGQLVWTDPILAYDSFGQTLGRVRFHEVRGLGSA